MLNTCTLAELNLNFMDTVRQAIYEIAEEFHSPESIKERFGESLLTGLVTHGYIEVDEEATHVGSPFDMRLEGEATAKLTDHGWAFERRLFRAS